MLDEESRLLLPCDCDDGICAGAVTERFALARGVGAAEPTALASLRRGIDGAGGGGTAAERGAERVFQVSVTSPDERKEYRAGSEGAGDVRWEFR